MSRDDTQTSQHVGKNRHTYRQGDRHTTDRQSDIKVILGRSLGVTQDDTERDTRTVGQTFLPLLREHLQPFLRATVAYNLEFLTFV